MDNDLHRPAIGLNSDLSASPRDIEARIAQGPPLSAEDYILRVRHEAKNMPNVFTASAEQIACFHKKETIGELNKAQTPTAPPFVAPKATTSVQVTQQATKSHHRRKHTTWTPTKQGLSILQSLRVPCCPTISVPSKLWVQSQLATFSDLRRYLSFWTAQFRAGNCSVAMKQEAQCRPSSKKNPTLNVRPIVNLKPAPAPVTNLDRIFCIHVTESYVVSDVVSLSLLLL